MCLQRCVHLHWKLGVRGCWPHHTLCAHAAWALSAPGITSCFCRAGAVFLSLTVASPPSQDPGTQQAHLWIQVIHSDLPQELGRGWMSEASSEGSWWGILQGVPRTRHLQQPKPRVETRSRHRTGGGGGQVCLIQESGIYSVETP